MRVIFADAGYWIALLNIKDELHNTAVHLSQALQPTRLVTSEMVLVEVLSSFSKQGNYFRIVAVNLIKSTKADPNTTIILQTTGQFNSALQLYESRLDKDWSLTDCASFQIMQRLKISEALAYDKHFIQAGYIALMREAFIN